MLTLSNIHKEYASGELRVEALKGVSLSFRKNEFVAVLGPSGCGKTTLLNIIGGLDRYTQGDLIIKGRSTREYKDADWDSYRNHSVGFVFQSYNLIPHQTVLSNVELALTLGGVPAKERRRRAVQALERVGLGDQLNKKHNEMSGGQMQRVAIARALVNDPEILLADEPTGALDSETSVQIMDVLKEIASDRLVIMVTHNPELAAQYATRTIRLLDGRVTDDTMPFDGQDDMAQPPARTGATSMHFGTALHLSLNNLMTKKGRTFMVALAGSIGIIGIALILSLSNGVNEYIKSVEEDTLAQYPLTIESETMNQSALLTAMMSASSGKDIPHEEGRVYSSNVMGDLMSAMVSEVNANDLPSFKAYLDGSQEIADLTSSIAYEYGSTLRIYNRNAVGGVQQVQPSTVIDTMTNSSMMSNANALASMSSMSSLSQMTSMYNMNVFFELAGPSVHRSGSYELLAGHMPQKYDELLLVVGEDDDISDTTLYTLGLRDQSEVQQLFMTLLTGSTVQTETISYSYDDLLNLTFTLVLPGNLYQEQGDGIYADISGDEAAMSQALDQGVTLHIAGIARSSSNSMISSMMAGGVGYTHELVEYVVSANNETPAVKAQRAHPDTDIFTGINFSGGVDMEPSMEMLDTYLNSLPQEQQTAVRAMIGMMSEERILSMMRAEMAKQKTDATYESNLAKLNATNLDTPTQIKIYPIDFESKQRIVDLIEQYNAQMQAAGHEEGVIRYTDYVGSLMSSVTTIVDTISYVLIAFVSISLVVSSIMITYISVLERTKEIGILRAMGASKGDVSRVFTAETLIIGLVAGFLGVLVTWLLTFPINALIHHLTQINAAAILPGGAAAILVAISMLLTILAGAIPSRMAAKKDPVVALRTE